MNWVLITGGAQGLGEEIAIHLALKRYNILIHCRKSMQKAVENAEKFRTLGVSAEVVIGDFSTPSGVEDFIQRCSPFDGQIKYLVHNVGKYLIASPQSTSQQDWNELFQVNLFAPIRITQALLPSIQKLRGGIVNIGVAGLGRLSADTYSTAYTSSKSALLVWTKSLAKELAAFEVSVNMASPGCLPNSTDSPQHFPMGRPASYSEVACAVSFFLEDQNRYITGQNLEIAGGVRL